MTRRRLVGTLTLAAVCALVSGANLVLEASLRPAELWSGGLLLSLVLLLTLFNARKKLPFLPLGSATAWMELHAYVGLLSVWVFLAHIDYGLPDGPFETVLFGVFGVVSGSGIAGLLLSRLLPLRLAGRGQEVLFERIPRLREDLRGEVEKLVLQCAEESEPAALGEFYSTRLSRFLEAPRHLVSHLLDSDQPYQMLERELSGLRRYAGPREREILSEIAERMRLKNDLDYQWAQQLALKSWLFVHIPLTYSLLILAAAHVLLVGGFR